MSRSALSSARASPVYCRSKSAVVLKPHTFRVSNPLWGSQGTWQKFSETNRLHNPQEAMPAAFDVREPLLDACEGYYAAGPWEPEECKSRNDMHCISLDRLGQAPCPRAKTSGEGQAGSTSGNMRGLEYTVM